MKKTMLVMAMVIALAMSTMGAALASSQWFQGFEENTDGWVDSANGWTGTIERVASGTDGITSADGNWHATVGGSSGPFSRFDGFRAEWPGNWIAEIDVYLDPSWDAGTGFDYTVASSKSDGGHLRDFIFHVTSDTSTGDLLVGGSNNTTGAPREDLETVNHYVVPEAGWYTLQHSFYDDGGVLAVDLNLIDDGNVVWTETLSNVADTIGDVGGNRYSWFRFATVAGLAVDNHELYFVVATPGDKDDCKNGGFLDFDFDNQGQCIASIQANENAGK